MTCDLIIGNGAGVALATEVVPANSRCEGSDPTTTMLGLPMPHAVGIVIRSGNSSIFGVPYETHLENWIQTLSEKPLGRLGSYAKSFRSHLEDVISANVSDIEVMRDFIWSWHDWLCKVRSDLERDGALSTEGVAQFFEARAERFVNGERITSEELSKKVYTHLGRGSRKNLLEKRSEPGQPESGRTSIEGTIEEVFGGHLDDRARRAIQTWAYRWLGYWHPSPNRCQITYVGYGRRDLVPGCDADKIEGYAFGKVYFRPRWVVSASSSGDGGGSVLFETIGRDPDVLHFISVLAGSPRSESEGSPSSEDFDAGVPDASFPLESERADIARLRPSIAGMSRGTLGLTSTRLVGLSRMAEDFRGARALPGSRIIGGLVTRAEGFRFLDDMNAVVST